jgi:hypothetical protein
MRTPWAAGRLVILQPNYYYCYRHHFDDYTHVTVYSHESLCDALRADGYEILECVPRFLPLSIKSRLPINPVLIRLYLASPWKPLAGQMLSCANIGYPPFSRCLTSLGKARRQQVTVASKCQRSISQGDEQRSDLERGKPGRYSDPT